MWEFAEATRGLGDAARALGTPVVSGNVSFYNETAAARSTRRRRSPWSACSTTTRATRSRTSAPRARASCCSARTARSSAAASGSRRGAASRRGARRRSTSRTSGACAELLAQGVAAGAIESAHDVSDGGLAVALAECCFTGRRAGRRARSSSRDAIRADALLFGESTGRVIVATADAEAAARARGAPRRARAPHRHDRRRRGCASRRAAARPGSTRRWRRCARCWARRHPAPAGGDRDAETAHGTSSRDLVEAHLADRFHDECGVFGVHGHPEAAHLTYLGLYALQHRGQESAGIASIGRARRRSLRLPRHGPGRRRLQRDDPREAARPPRDRARALFDGRRQPARERAALLRHHRRRSDRDRAQRQPGQRGARSGASSRAAARSSAPPPTAR